MLWIPGTDLMSSDISIFHYCQINTSVWLRDTLHSCCIFFFPLWLSSTVDTTADSLLAGRSACCNLSPEQSWLKSRWCCGMKESANGGLWVKQKKGGFRRTAGRPGRNVGLWRRQRWHLRGDTEVVVVVSWHPRDGKLWGLCFQSIAFSTDCNRLTALPQLSPVFLKPRSLELNPLRVSTQWCHQAEFFPPAFDRWYRPLCVLMFLYSLLSLLPPPRYNDFFKYFIPQKIVEWNEKGEIVPGKTCCWFLQNIFNAVNAPYNVTQEYSMQYTFFF